MRIALPLAIAALVASATAFADSDSDLQAQAARLFGKLETPHGAATPEQTLGRALFWDRAASADGKTACASCHAAADWGADSRRFSPDARGELASRQSPTVFNSTLQPFLRWLGDRKTAAAQAEGSLTGSLGFASKQAAVEALRRLGYADAFRTVYPADAEPLTPANYGRAVAAYEATLVTPARFDRYLGGDAEALTPAEKRGLALFIATGCAGCHNGALLGGASFQRFGVVKPYWSETGSDKPDAGRFAVTKKEEDRYVFRVPMLRNVAKTAPYFHDGSVESLPRAVAIMASVQLGRTLDKADTAAIVAFLGSLTGELPANYSPPR
ncbi:MAG: cytochrome-c peroxidase [Clostridia bacterium]